MPLGRRVCPLVLACSLSSAGAGAASCTASPGSSLGESTSDPVARSPPTSPSPNHHARLDAACVRACGRSSVADMKNSVADRSNAQVSCAGQFIANHIEQFVAGPAAGGGRWLHIDMASPAHYGERCVRSMRCYLLVPGTWW